tara:strand:+ start:1609 stop:1794 length:186 start_codon:yes stop_codon:yes gene_type:complete
MTGLEMLRFCKEAYSDFRVDWIVLTASLVGLAIVILASLYAGDDGLVANMGDYLTPGVSGT